MPPASTPTPRRPARTAPSVRRTSSGRASSRWTRSARRAGIDAVEIRRLNLLHPGEEVRPGGKPLDADLVGDIDEGRPRRWAGTATSAPAPAAASRWVCWRPAPTRCPAPSCAWRRTARRSCSVGSTEMGQGQRTAFAQIAAEVLGMPAERVRCKGTDTQFTPYDRSTGRQPLHHARGPGRPARRGGGARGPAGHRGRAIWPDAGEAPELRDGAAWFGDELADATRSSIAKRFGLSGGQLIGEGGVHPEGTGSYAEGPVFWEVCIGAAEVQVDRETGVVHVAADRDHRGRGHGHQPAARGAPGRGRHDAGHRQRAVRGDGLRGRPAAQRQPPRVPHPDRSRTCRPSRSASSWRTPTGRVRSGPRAAARAPSPASSRPSPRRWRMPACPSRSCRSRRNGSGGAWSVSSRQHQPEEDPA